MQKQREQNVRTFTRASRPGMCGRIGVISLAAAHDDLAESWARAAVALKEAGRLSDEEVRRLCWLDAFGAVIANTDRHQSYVLFFAEGSRSRLAPAFDQVSMPFAPTGDGRAVDSTNTLRGQLMWQEDIPLFTRTPLTSRALDSITVQDVKV